MKNKYKKDKYNNWKKKIKNKNKKMNKQVKN